MLYLSQIPDGKRQWVERVQSAKQQLIYLLIVPNQHRNCVEFDRQNMVHSSRATHGVRLFVYAEY